MTNLKTLALAITLALCFPAGALANCGSAADRDPASPGASMHSARSATLCLLNRERRARHLGTLHSNDKLTLAGLRHARDMVKNNYFSHDALSGENFVQRIMNTNYVPPAANWWLGENLAWGNLDKSTPREIVRAWMASPDHRHNILNGTFREIGIAIVHGAPVRGKRDAATYATEFGAVHKL
jgi:uncharacterized protein YkwD